jgi:hypothetical protein
MKIIAALLLVTHFSIYSCQDENVQGTKFEFYPKSNIYYDVEKERYYLIVNDEWQRKKNITKEQQSRLGKHVRIDKPGVPVWKDNEQHRLIYGTALYTSSADYRRKFYEDSIKSLPKKPVVPMSDSVRNEENKRSGVRKFLDRLFGKERAQTDSQQKKKTGF